MSVTRQSFQRSTIDREFSCHPACIDAVMTHGLRLGASDAEGSTSTNAQDADRIKSKFCRAMESLSRKVWAHSARRSRAERKELDFSFVSIWRSRCRRSGGCASRRLFADGSTVHHLSLRLGRKMHPRDTPVHLEFCPITRRWCRHIQT